MKKILQDKSFRLSILITTLFIGTGILFLFLGLTDYSWTLFVLLPVVLGIAVGTMKVRKYALHGAILTTVLLLIAIYIPGMSGVICIVMAIVLVIPFIFLGYVVVRLAKRYRKINDTNKLSILTLPLLPFLIVAPSEHYLKKEKEEIISVSTEKIFDYSPEQVFDAIKSVDTLDAEKPLLLQFDLPIPVKCVLEKEEVGAKRICYFKGGRMSNADFGGGTITEIVTEYERGKVLKMDVVDYTLVGRNWLGFKEAIYYFEPIEEGKCKMTRITTYTSVLTPRFYWEPMEKLGIQQEHEYVFNNLEKDLKNQFD
ncbi:polyketide cyclase [Parapedobacter sp. SGR-10]|uniref:SRPBCC family protein n=1 Tax=Parapedobacter sp. SGR-10 TaxID=2710879 RepID=UPI0013D01929|nr:SRPBCC family protein [Parapedobacter sp. SGR-10]NGF58240.1 polyketide cyclase [Parapedobacter sp. SGR-10]